MKKATPNQKTQYEKKKARQEISVQSSSGSSSTTDANSGRVLNVMEFAEARMFEINAMEKSLLDATQFKGKQRVWQTLPRFMRRRAASYNPKRLPRRVRNRAVEQNTKDPGNPQKASISKFKSNAKNFKRRAKTIEGEFAMRQRKKFWLETHLWHAKRMKMVDLWGFRLAEHPNDKSIRACYRAALHQCIMTDISFYIAIELVGPTDILINGLNRVTDPTIPGVGSKKFLAGHRQGETLLFAKDSYPANLIAPISFIWKASQSPDPANGAIWIWIHPAAFDEALTTLQKLFDGLDVTVTSLKKELVVFDLFGPRAHAILQEALNVVDEGEGAKKWKEIKDLRTTTSLSPKVILALEIRDPRLTFPPKMSARTTTAPLQSSTLSTWPSSLANSTIWDASHRSQILESRLLESKINQMKSEDILKTGAIIAKHIKENDQRILILLIENGKCVALGNEGRKIGGWRVILPKGWGNALWRSLIYCGARATGMREQRHLNLEMSIPTFPDDFPGTSSYSTYVTTLSSNSESNQYEEWKRKPPMKRMGVDLKGEGVLGRPFGCAWDHIVNGVELNILEEPEQEGKKKKKVRRGGKKKKVVESTEDPDTAMDTSNDSEDPGVKLAMVKQHSSFATLSGSRNILQLLETAVKGANNSDSNNIFWSAVKESIASGSRKSIIPYLQNLNNDCVLNLDRVAVKIYLNIIGGGDVKENARIYEVGSEGVEFWLKKDPSEEKNEQSNAVFEKWMIPPNSDMTVNKAQPPTLDMRPPDSSIIGFVTTGGYIFSRGNCGAVGSIVASRALRIFRFSTNGKVRVLVKSVGDRMCRVAECVMIP